MGLFSQEPKQPADSTGVESSEMEMADALADTVMEECDPEALLRQLAQKDRENQELKEKNDHLLRHVADMENFRKRLEKERADLRDFANESLMKELLPVVDHLELALNHGRQEEAGSALLEGVENVLKGFLQALTKFGVTPIQALGEKFDPAFHHAVMQQEDDSVDDQTIIQELQKGYLLKNRLLRPATVVVARNPQS
jgi:molecular chaperone GrpE